MRKRSVLFRISPKAYCRRSFSTRVRMSTGGFFSTPEKNFSHSICSWRIHFSSRSRSSPSDANALRLPFQEEPEEGKPQLPGVRRPAAVNEDVGRVDLPHDRVEVAKRVGLGGTELRSVLKPVAGASLAIDRGPLGESQSPRIVGASEGVKDHAHPERARASTRVQDVHEFVGQAGHILLVLRNHAGKPVGKTQRTIPTHGPK